jgi:hypothetical protein
VLIDGSSVAGEGRGSCRASSHQPQAAPGLAAERPSLSRLDSWSSFDRSSRAGGRAESRKSAQMSFSAADYGLYRQINLRRSTEKRCSKIATKI